MSELSEAVEKLINNTFPGYKIFPEWYIDYKNERLFFDFYIKDLRLFVECQGEQHYRHVKFFHGSSASYRAALRRDRLKLEYAQENKFRILYINNKNLPRTSSELIDLVHKRMFNDHKYS